MPLMRAKGHLFLFQRVIMIWLFFLKFFMKNMLFLSCRYCLSLRVFLLYFCHRNNYKNVFPCRIMNNKYICAFYSMEKNLLRYLTMFPSLSSPNQSLQKILSVNCWIFHRWKLQLLTIENGSVVIRGMLRIMIELMGLISRENMRQREQQIKIKRPIHLSGS